MTRPEYIDAAIDRAYKLEAVLRIASDAAMEDNGQFGLMGGSTVLAMAADMAGEIVNGLELSKK